MSIKYEQAELVELLDEHWKKEALESIFGSEDLFAITHVEYPTEDGDTDFKKVPCEIVIRRIVE